jgi:hypothetical protein
MTSRFLACCRSLCTYRLGIVAFPKTSSSTSPRYRLFVFQKTGIERWRQRVIFHYLDHDWAPTAPPSLRRDASPSKNKSVCVCVRERAASRVRAGVPIPDGQRAGPRLGGARGRLARGVTHTHTTPCAPVLVPVEQARGSERSGCV